MGWWLFSTEWSFEPDLLFSCSDSELDFSSDSTSSSHSDEELMNFRRLAFLGTFSGPEGFFSLTCDFDVPV